MTMKECQIMIDYAFNKFNDSLEKISKAQSKSAVVHGHWKEKNEPIGWSDVMCAECSVCREDFVLGEYGLDDIKSCFKHCPNCGAKMDEEVRL